MPDPLSLDEAVAIGSVEAPPGSEIRSYAAGDFQGVAQKIDRPGSDLVRNLPVAELNRLVWGLLFETPDDLTAVFLDLFDGEVLNVDVRDIPRRMPDVHKSEIFFDVPVLHVSNNTTLFVNVFVDGELVLESEPSTESSFDLRTVAVSPWTIIARTMSGRELVQFDARAEQIWHTESDYPLSSSGVGGRADLSCGRLDVWSGPQPLGPAPGPDFPAGDCDP